MDEAKMQLQSALTLAVEQLRCALEQEQDTKALKELTAVLKELTELTAKLYASADDTPKETTESVQVVFRAGPAAWNE